MYWMNLKPVIAAIKSWLRRVSKISVSEVPFLRSNLVMVLPVSRLLPARRFSAAGRISQMVQPNVTARTWSAGHASVYYRRGTHKAFFQERWLSHCARDIRKAVEDKNFHDQGLCRRRWSERRSNLKLGDLTDANVRSSSKDVWSIITEVNFLRQWYDIKGRKFFCPFCNISDFFILLYTKNLLWRRGAMIGSAFKKLHIGKRFYQDHRFCRSAWCIIRRMQIAVVKRFFSTPMRTYINYAKKKYSVSPGGMLQWC